MIDSVAYNHEIIVTIKLISNMNIVVWLFSQFYLKTISNFIKLKAVLQKKSPAYQHTWPV